MSLLLVCERDDERDYGTLRRQDVDALLLFKGSLVNDVLADTVIKRI